MVTTYETVVNGADFLDCKINGRLVGHVAKYGKRFKSILYSDSDTYLDRISYHTSQNKALARVFFLDQEEHNGKEDHGSN